MQPRPLRKNPALLGITALAAAALGTLVASCAWGRPPRGAGSPVPGKARCVGSANCTRCHQEAHARWVESSHAKTLAEAVETNMPPAVVAGEAVAHPPGRTQFHRRDGRYLAETAGPDGRPLRKNTALREAILPILEANAEDDLRWFLLGAARRLHGDYRGAIAAYQRVCELDPFANELQREIQNLEKKLGQ